MPQNLVDAALHLAAIARTQQRMHVDVVGLEHRICFELAAPIALFGLLTQHPRHRAVDARDDFVHRKV